MIFGRRRIAFALTLVATMGISGAMKMGHAAPLRPPALPSILPVMTGDDDDNDAAPLLTVIVDLNRDGTPDMVAARPRTPGTPGLADLIVLRGRKDGGFSQSAILPLSNGNPSAIASGDFNGDGIPDIVVGEENGALLEFKGDGKGNLVPTGEIAHFGSVVSIATADFDHDGKLDLAISDSHSGTVSILLGAGAGIFRAGWSFRLPMPGSIYRLAAADFNHDGLPDLAVTTADGEAYEVMLGNGNGTFTSSPELSHLKDPNAHCVT